MYKVRALCATAIMAFAACTWAEVIQINEIPSPHFTEVQQVSNDQWLLIEEVEGFSLPLTARIDAGSQRDLLFTVNGEKYRIARADVVLADEVLVTSACDTVPLALASDTRSASVKGAGESCH